MKQQQYIMMSIVGLAIYLIATGLSFGVFAMVVVPRNPGSAPLQPGLTVGGTPDGTGGHFVIDPSIPKTEICPLNGAYFTKQERDLWEKRRPLAVMIENHAESRPQSGLSSADIVYEVVAEGGITRFMGIYYCGTAGNITLAPVRSARIYFLAWVSEYDALYNHVGGAGNCNDGSVDNRAKALCQIENWKIKDMDQFGISFPTCYRNYDRLDHAVATEHTMVCFTDKLYKLAETRGWTNVDTKGIAWDKTFEQWKYKDDAKESERGASFSASFVAWKGYEREYGVKWDFEPSTNTYLRFNGGLPHTDLESKEQLRAKVVIIQYAKETGPVDDHAHLLYENIGTGTGFLWQDGRETAITWKKATRTARTKFYDASGKELLLNRGKIWIELLPTGTQIKK